MTDHIDFIFLLIFFYFLIFAGQESMRNTNTSSIRKTIGAPAKTTRSCTTQQNDITSEHGNAPSFGHNKQIEGLLFENR